MSENSRNTEDSESLLLSENSTDDDDWKLSLTSENSTNTEDSESLSIMSSENSTNTEDSESLMLSEKSIKVEEIIIEFDVTENLSTVKNDEKDLTITTEQ